MTISIHQKWVIQQMREGKELWECVMHVRTITRLQKLGLIEKVPRDNPPYIKWVLSEEGKTIELK